MPSDIIYRDKLVEIATDSILLRQYYIFSLGSKRLNFSDIERIEVRDPSFAAGKWRLQGSGDFRTWFAFDSNRPKRDKIFVIRFPNKSRRIGFTVENSEQVVRILKDKRLIH